MKLPASIFYEGLRRTSFAVTDDEKRFTINGILLLIEDSILKMVSTDGHRLCYFRMTTSAGAGNNLRCLIPKKAADELRSLLTGEIKANPQAEVKIKKGSQLEFSIGSKTMTARELTGNFPNWEMVLPKNFISFAEINARELREALNRVGVMADDRNRRVEFEFHADKVILKTESPETGNSVEEVGCTFQKLDNAAATDMEGGFRIAFNTKYLTDFFSIHAARTNDGRIIWKFSGESAQTELAFEGEERLFSYILVPLKV